MIVLLFLSFNGLLALFSVGLSPDVPVNPLLLLGVLIGVIEVVARAVPTIGQWAPLGVILNILKSLSDFFNREKH